MKKFTLAEEQSKAIGVIQKVNTVSNLLRMLKENELSNSDKQVYDLALKLNEESRSTLMNLAYGTSESVENDD